MTTSKGDTDYTDLRQRFRSRDDEQFRSAFLELYLHESLIRAGYAVTIHPTVEGTTAHPDFLVGRDGERLYIEAIAPGSSPAAKAAAERRAVLFDTAAARRHLAAREHPSWRDTLRVRGRPRAPEPLEHAASAARPRLARPSRLTRGATRLLTAQSSTGTRWSEPVPSP